MNKKVKQSISIPVEVLGLSDIEIENVSTDLRARQITIRVSSTKDEILCRECNKPTNPHGRGRLLRLRKIFCSASQNISKLYHREQTPYLKPDDAAAITGADD